jgi:hypothetical protein
VVRAAEACAALHKVAPQIAAPPGYGGPDPALFSNIVAVIEDFGAEVRRIEEAARRVSPPAGGFRWRPVEPRLKGRV